ncbi:hypothetical protein [Candidatus Nitronereus thalassa]|uniref:Transposase n=1 Tax=Candidatus Nitronereus thalassa TaxID=3020898 RepID=A0ABU3K367_9BACT|nr:hypothetical protein [Candidatus Nitronereus thalassa]MDT7040842.1 hypothetical protein [Candidatus Nitronereus thalassa]
MTSKQLDAALTRTFEAARWADSHGQPTCPKCFDAEDVRVVTQPSRPQVCRGAVPSYHCTCCLRYFASTYDTPLQQTKIPLACWACVVLAGRPGSLYEASQAWGITRKALYAMLRKLEPDHPFIGRWRQALKRAGITAEQCHRHAVKEGA